MQLSTWWMMHPAFSPGLAWSPADSGMGRESCSSWLVLFIAALLVNIASAQEARKANQLHGPNSILLLGHRGAPEFVPEHTLASYSLAMRQRVDYIEPDICLTSDGHAICMHDFELSATTNVADHPEFADRYKEVILPSGTYRGWFTNDFTLAEIKTLRVKQRLHNRDTYYNGLFTVPTLNETLKFLKKKNAELGLNVGIYIEPKHPGYFERNGLIFDQHLINVLESNGMIIKGPKSELSKVIIECFEATQLRRLRPLMDLLFVQLVKEPWVIQDDTVEPFGYMMNRTGLEIISQFANAIGPIKDYYEPQNKAFIDRCTPDILIGKSGVDGAHELGLVIHPWTARNSWEDPLINAYFDGSEEAQLRYLFDLGIDGIFTESAAAAYYERKAYQASFETHPNPPQNPPIEPHTASSTIALYITIPLLCSLFTLLIGVAVGRYYLPYNTAKSHEALSLLNSGVQ